MAAACVRWAWGQFGSWHAESLEKDRDWGLVTVRQRVLFRLGLIAEMLAESGFYPAVAETTRRTLDHLSREWKDVAPMPLYPAFRK